jgi:hypothetical protein
MPIYPAPALTCHKILTEQIFQHAQQTIAITITHFHKLQMENVFLLALSAGLFYFQMQQVATITHHRVHLRQTLIA